MASVIFSNRSSGNSLAGSQPFGFVVVDTTARLVVVVSSWEVPHFAWDNLDSLDFAVRSAHTYSPGSKCSVVPSVDCKNAEQVADAVANLLPLPVILV